MHAVVNTVATEPPSLTALHVAALHADTQLVHQLLLAGADPTLRTDFGATPLHLAARASALQVIELLLQLSACSFIHLDVDASANSGATPLMYAARTGSVPIAHALLRMPHQADVDAQADTRLTALHIAAANGHEQFVSLLLCHGAAANAPDAQGRVPLLHALENAPADKKLPVTQALLHAGALPSIRDKPRCMSPLAYAAYTGLTDVVNVILAFARTLDRPIQLGNATFSSNLDKSAPDTEIVPATQPHEYQPSDPPDSTREVSSISVATIDNQMPESGKRPGFTPLAMSKTHVSLALDSVDLCGHTPLALAAMSGHSAIVRSLADALRASPYFLRVDPFVKDNDGRTPLWHAARKGHSKACLALFGLATDFSSARIDNRNSVQRVPFTDVFAADSHSLTPLHVAALNGHAQTCRLLLSHGASVNALDERGRTALTIAALSGHAVVCRLLLESSSDPICPGKDGRTPLWLASHGGHRSVVSELLRNSIIRKAVDHRSRTGATALFAACQAGHPEVSASLLRAGAYVDAVNAAGSSPLWAAAERGHAAVVRVLLENYACIDLADRNGKSPIVIACANGHVDVAKLLLSRNCVIDFEQSAGFATLLEAAKQTDRQDLTIVLQDYRVLGDSDLTDVGLSSGDRCLEHINAAQEEAPSRNSYSWLRKLPSAHRSVWRRISVDSSDNAPRRRFSIQL